MVTKISFISNTGETHKAFLLNLFKQADEVIFAVGFLKKSGLNIIKDYLKVFCADGTKSCSFYIGTGLGETDADALHSLYNIIKYTANHKLILCTPDAGIFHPKIYVFRTGVKTTIVTGSSNLTQHGWEVNDEVSMISETTSHSSQYLQLAFYFNQLYNKYFSDDVEAIIKRYKKEREDYLTKYGKGPVFRFRRSKSIFPEIDLPRLRKYYEIYKNSDEYIIPEKRESQYLKAKNNLEALASNKILNDIQFHKFFGQLVGHKDYKPKLWHSGSIHRTTYKTLSYPESFREIVRLIKANLSEPVSIVYDTVMDAVNRMRKENLISGVGANIITEILLSYNPQKFANLNDNPLAVLAVIGKTYTKSVFNGEDYAEYVNLLITIKDELEMTSLLEIDSFFNYVYWNLIEE